MKLTNNKTSNKLWPAVLCGVLSLLADFILLPHVFTLITVLGFPIPDPIWISVMILIPVVISLHILEQNAHILARYVWVGLPVQYLILIVFSVPMRKISPIASDSWTYIWEATIWPLSATTAQFVSLIIFRVWKAKRSK